MLFDIELVLIGEEAGLKVHRVINLRARDVDMSAGEGVDSKSRNSNTRVTRRQAEVSREPV